jgi:glycosyltransferase involved in cell wall biosynthesis
MSAPLVSVITIAYNQERYIREALDGFLKQKASFAFEVLIGDDNSSDSTPEIIQEYADKHPKLIKFTRRANNIGPWENFTDLLKSSKAKYIAICEGDDYWTDNNKLAKQVEFLEHNPSYALCFHQVKVLTEGSIKQTVFPEDINKKSCTIETLLKRNYIQTNSVVYRRQNYGSLAKGMMPGDWYLHLYHARFGQIGYIPEVMSVYRRHVGGIWWESDTNLSGLWKKHGMSHLAMYVELLNMFSINPRHKQIIEANIFKLLDGFFDTDQKLKTTLITQAMKQYPAITAKYIQHLNDLIQTKTREFLMDQKTIETLGTELQHVQDEARRQAQVIEGVRASRVWKARNRIADILGKPKV